MVALYIVVFALLALFVVCAFKESKTTGLYKALGVYGRIKAYLFADLLLAGIAFVVFGLVRLVSPGTIARMGVSLPGALPSILIGLVCAAIAVVIYLSAKQKCPARYSGKLLTSMLISGMGIGMKIAIFFLPFIWKLSMPHFDEYVDANGKTLLVDSSGDVFDRSGTRVGKKTGSNTYVKNDY
ncbi:MAG: hypothetical protein Q4C10_11800 [Clostridia bacterium]|nr:hypothetical protein [Clostridia bacterium]